MEQVVELFALACIEPVITDELSAIGQKENWRMRWSTVHRGSISPRHVGRLLQEAQQTTPDPLLVDSRTKNLTPKSVTLPSFT